jgi:hypothetical protein
MCDLMMGQRRNMKYAIWIYTLRGKEGRRYWSHSCCPFDSIDRISFNNMMKREYFTTWIMELWK